MKKIIITGSLGQDGFILTKKLLQKNYKVFGFIKNNKSKKKLDKANYILENLKNFNKLKKNINKINPDIVIHLASNNESHKKSKNDNFTKYYKENLKITKNLIDLCFLKNPKLKFILAGSSMMYEGLSKKKISEKDSFKPKSYYSKYKVDAHKYLIKIKKQKKVDASTVILFNHDSKFRNKKFLLPRLVEYIKRRDIKKIINIHNDNIIKDYSHADDICNCIISIIESKKNLDKIILSSGKLTKLNKIIDYLLKISKMSIDLKNTKSKNRNNMLGQNKLAKKEFKWRIKKDIFLASKELLFS